MLCFVATLSFAFVDKLAKAPYVGKLVNDDDNNWWLLQPKRWICPFTLSCIILGTRTRKLTHGGVQMFLHTAHLHPHHLHTYINTQNREFLAMMRSTRSTTAFLALLVASSTNAFLLPSPSAATTAARSPNFPTTAATVLHATTVPRGVGLEAIPDADLKEADKTPPPSTFFECTLQAYNSAAAAIKDGYKLLEVEFPPLPAAEMASQVCRFR